MRPYKSIYLLVYFLFFCTSVHTANHYVDKNANGNNNGTSWSNAWESFSDIDWSQILPGDVLYISGGPDSTIYYEELHIGDVDGTANARITIRNSYDIGHNGRVIIDGQNETRTNSVLIGDNSGAYNASYVTLKGIEARGGQKGIHLRYYCDNIIIDSCIVYDWYDQAGIMIQGAGSSNYETWGMSNITIKNCEVISFVNEPGQTDCIYFQRASNTIIHDNFIHQRNRSTINNHSDGIQSHLIRGAKIYNNIAICDSNAQGMPMIIRGENIGDDADSVIFYNNFMYSGGGWYSGFPWINILDHQSNVTGSTEPPTIVIHNTMVSNGSNVLGLWFERIDQPEMHRMHNNIIAMFGSGTGGSGSWLEIMRGTAIMADSITGTLFYREWGGFRIYGNNSVEGNGNAGACYTWDRWVNTYGGTGTYGDPLFVDDIGNVGDQATLDGELQSGSPAINAGLDIQAIVEGMGLPWTDINGNARDSSPDIGAYEYGP